MSKQNNRQTSGKKPAEQSINDWLLKGLTECLMFEPPVDLIKHVMLAETEEALVDFLHNLLDMKRSECQRFVNDVVRIRNLPREKKSVYEAPASTANQLTASAQSQPADNQRKASPAPTSKHSTAQGKAISLRDAGQLDRMVLPGRRPCQCLGTKHGLVTNCLKCGRIVCQQEGPGPCLFCGNPVGEMPGKGTTTLKDVIASQTVPSEGQEGAGLRAALEHRDKLLEYDKTSAQRTKIYDDQSDFFSTGGAWLNETERKSLIDKQAKLYDQRFGPRRHKTVALDFAGRQIVDVAPKEATFDDLENDEVAPSKTHSQPPGFGRVDGGADYLVNPMTAADSEYIEPKYVADEDSSKTSRKKTEKESDFSVRPGRLQDAELMEMTDRGVCLSVQQPYASLIVLGFKRFEGRAWATSHRGRLWIVSSSKPCTQEMVSSVEKFYKALFGDDKLAFPSNYPSACLMGCVDLVDCLPQEQFREKFPNGECEDPFVWVLTNPRLLSIQFPVTGQKPNLYRLSAHIHRAASRAIIPS